MNTLTLEYLRLCACTCMLSSCFRYDLKDTSKLILQDVLFPTAMGPPGGGRNDVTARFLRHYNIIGMNPFSEETMIKIFSILLTTYLRVSSYTKDNSTMKNINFSFMNFYCINVPENRNWNLCHVQIVGLCMKFQPSVRKFNLEKRNKF